MLERVCVNKGLEGRGQQLYQGHLCSGSPTGILQTLLLNPEHRHLPEPPLPLRLSWWSFLVVHRLKEKRLGAPTPDSLHLRLQNRLLLVLTLMDHLLLRSTARLAPVSRGPREKFVGL